MSEEIAMSAYKKAKTADGKADANTASIATLTNQGQVEGFVVLTQAQYDALATKDPKIVYLIRG